MTTAEEELEMLVEKYSEGELKEAQKELGIMSLEEQERVEEELTEFSSKNKIRTELEGEISSATILDMGLTEDSEEDLNGDVYVKFQLPCDTTTTFTFNSDDFQDGSIGNKFLNKLGCTVSDISNISDVTLPITYEQTYSGGWKVVVYYGDRSNIREIIENPEEYRVNHLGVAKELPTKTQAFSLLSPVVVTILVGYMSTFFVPFMPVGCVIALGIGIIVLSAAVTYLEIVADCKTEKIKMRL